MNQMKLISFLLIVAILNSCSILDSDSNSSQVLGKWEWLLSTGGFAGETITPDSTDVPDLQLFFNPILRFSFSELIR